MSLTAADVLSLAGGPGLLAGDASWFSFEGLFRSSLVVSAAPSNPWQASVWDGGTFAELSAVEALSLVEQRHLETPVSLDADVLDVAALAAAGPCDRPGLLPFQDHLVSSLLASDTGVVLASPPGSGKSVMVASALGEFPGLTRALVVVPSGLTGQWVTELGRWAPGVSCTVGRSSSELSALLRNHQVVVVSAGVAARWEGVSRQRLDVLVVDEAVALLRGSATASALWRLRARSRVAWALTGSPAETTSRGGVSRLVQWCRDLATYDPAATVAAFGPLVLSSVPETVPRLDLLAHGVVPSREESAAIGDVALDPGFAGLERVREVERLRRRLARPLGDVAECSKEREIASLVRRELAAGGRVLLFASSLALLEWQVRELADVGAALLPPSGRSERVRTLSAFSSGAVQVLGVPPGAQRGVNLQAADVVVHLDLPLTGAEFAQRNGRAARIGGREVVRVFVPYFVGSVEEQVVTQLMSAGSEFSLPGVLAEL